MGIRCSLPSEIVMYDLHQSYEISSHLFEGHGRPPPGPTDRGRIIGIDVPLVSSRLAVPSWFLVALFGLVGASLRAPLGSVPPLLDEISADLGLSAAVQGLLTGLAVVCMGLSAPAGAALARRVGSEATVATALAILAGAEGSRLFVDTTGSLLVSIGALGVGMGLAGAVLPGLVAHYLPHIRGLAMGVYATGQTLGIAAAVWVATPSAVAFGGWRPALALWGPVTLGILAAWVLCMRRPTGSTPSATGPPAVAVLGLPWTSSVARRITAFTTLQVTVGFCAVAWLVPWYVDHGESRQAAAGHMVLFQTVQLFAMLGLPALTDIMRARRPVLALTTLCTMTGALLIVSEAPLPAYAPVALFGLGVGGGAALGLVLIIDATGSRVEAARLGAMVFLVAYVMGGFGPLAMGALRDAMGTLTGGFWLLVVLTVAQLVIVARLSALTSIDHPAETPRQVAT